MDESRGNKRSTALLTAISAVAAAVVVLGAYFLLRSPAPKDASGPIVVSRRASIDLKALDAAQAEPAKEPALQNETPVGEPQARQEAPAPPHQKPVMDAKAKATLVIDKAKKEVSESGQAPEPEKAAKKKDAPTSGKKPLALLLKKPWVVNAASFSTASEAAGFASSLRDAGFNAYVTEFTKDGKKWHRVRAGFFPTRQEAQKASKSLVAKYKVKSPWATKADAKEIAKNAR